MPHSQEAGGCNHIYTFCALLERSNFVYWKILHTGTIKMHGEVLQRKKNKLCWVQSRPRIVFVYQHYVVLIPVNRCICIVSKPEIIWMYSSLKIYQLGLGWGSCSSNVSTMYNIPALLCSADTILNLPQKIIVSEYGCTQRWIFFVFSRHKSHSWTGCQFILLYWCFRLCRQ